jgi:hypothetical protein
VKVEAKEAANQAEVLQTAEAPKPVQEEKPRPAGIADMLAQQSRNA